MMRLIKFFNTNFVIIAAIMLLFDIVYLSTIGSKLFVPMLNKIQGEKMRFKMVPTIICYLLLVFVMNYFIISQNKKPSDAFILGVCIYGVYDTVNLATFNKWNPWGAVIDTFWGGILFYMTTLITYKIKNKFKI